MWVLFSDYTFQVVAVGAFLLGILCAVLGCFALLRKQSLLGDGISHGALPGVFLTFMITGTKNTEFLLLGGLLSGLFATCLILYITKKSRLPFDSALALVLSVFFGIALIFLTIIQKTPNANQAGLERFIYGQVSGMVLRDVKIIAMTGVVVLFLILLFWKEFKIITFDPEFAYTLGYDVKKINALLTALIVVSILLALQLVGVILLSALFISPAIAGRQWATYLWSMVLLSAVFGGISAVLGAFFSSSISKIPTGSSIVICTSVFVFFSLIFAPKQEKKRKNNI